jgi:arylsulfatase A-like enzyme
MGIYGYGRQNTPRLQEFLKTSTVYTKAIASAPITLSSHASMFTGLYPQSHGAYLSRPLVPQIPTLAQILTSSGYRTSAVVANKYYLRREFHTLHGFHIKQRLVPMNLVYPGHDYLLRNRLRDVLRIGAVIRDLDNDSVTSDEINRDAFATLDEFRQENAPFFLFLNYMDAHVPYLPSPPYNKLYPGLDLGFTSRDYNQTAAEVNGLNRPLKPAARAHLVSQYDGAIAELDERMQELMDRLKANGEFDRTMIIITSDHGEAFGDRNLLFHNTSVYEDQVHIPLLVKYPGQHDAEKVDVTVSNVDLMPTVLKVAGLAMPTGLEGADLRNIPPDRVVVAETRGNEMLYPRFRRTEWALYSGKFKMIYSTDGSRELYDLSADPGERQNLYKIDAPITVELRDKLVDWSRRTLPRYLEVGPANRFVDERLKSLGYAHQGVD